MTSSDETLTAPPPPPGPVPMYDPHGPQAMLSVTPGGPIPRWVIVVSVAYGLVSILFGVIYVVAMLSSWD